MIQPSSVCQNEDYRSFPTVSCVCVCLIRNEQINTMPKLEVTIVPPEVGELWDEILEATLNDVCRTPAPAPHLPLASLIPHTYHANYNVHHAQTYQQRTGNLCGYHAAFNAVCFLSLLEGSQQEYSLLSGASFWSFKRRIERFLLAVKAQHRLAEEWPWRQQDILHGDFQRTYNKLCLQRFPGFSVFRQHPHFQFLSYTWEFQYQNLLLSEEKRRELNRIIARFKNHKDEQPLVVSFMLAITNHWMLLIALKTCEGSQYWFFDSTNRDFLGLDENQIQELVLRLDQERREMGREPFSEFFKKNMAVCMKDTQISLKLIVDCLEGRTTIEEYSYNQDFAVFAKKLQVHWETDRAATEHTLKEYWYNITAFFRNPVQYHLLTPQNQTRMLKLIRLSHELKGSSEEGSRLNSLLRKYSHM